MKQFLSLFPVCFLALTVNMAHAQQELALIPFDDSLLDIEISEPACFNETGDTGCYLVILYANKNWVVSYDQETMDSWSTHNDMNLFGIQRADNLVAVTIPERGAGLLFTHLSNPDDMFPVSFTDISAGRVLYYSLRLDELPDDSETKDHFVMPQLIGGIQALGILNYPDEARRAGVSGMVRVQFTVRIDGTVSDVQTIEGIGYGCDEEAERWVSAMKFTPGTRNGEIVEYQMTQTVVFRNSEN